jgi:hypothetical protein
MDSLDLSPASAQPTPPSGDLRAARDLIATQLDLTTTSWSIGVLGALAEFERVDNEPYVHAGGFSLTTARGAISLEPTADMRVIAYEIPSARADSWLHGIALCAPVDLCRSAQRRVVTELGPDAKALRATDRSAILFDLGLGSAHCDFYVRCAAERGVALLREACGRTLLDDHALFSEIAALSPHRVFESVLGRIEVYQPIGKPEGRTPAGPHTHLLPKLLRASERSANLPIPAGWAVCATAYPAHPARDHDGETAPFDADKHRAFQTLLEDFGDPAALAAKHAVTAAVRGGLQPGDLPVPPTRHGRLACKVALRQLLYTDGPSALLEAWRRELDIPGRAPASAH